MGKGRDKRRKHEDPAKAARRAARQASKAQKHEAKKTTGDNDNDNDEQQQLMQSQGQGSGSTAMLHGFNNEEAIATTLKRIQKAQSKRKTIEELTSVPPPSPRVNAVLLPHPERAHELLLFGGEYWDGATTTAYNDTYFYNIKRRTWGQLVSAVNPPPRSSAQAVVYKHYVVLFGGEFVSQSQSQYLHFRDVWRYDARRSEWSEVKPARSLALNNSNNTTTSARTVGGSSGSAVQSYGPSARSGHRMVLWRRQAVLFGGFYDNAQECHYYNDLWLLSGLDAVVQWTRVTTQASNNNSSSSNNNNNTTTTTTMAAGEAPHPRSGHGMAVYKDTLFVYGGYSTERYNRLRKSEATVHHDLWMLSLPLTSEQQGGSSDKDGGGSAQQQQQQQQRRAGGNVCAVWVKLKLGGVPPPIRAGVAVAFRDKRMYMFGGVVDIESPGGKLVSTFYNDLFVFHMDTRRFYPVVLRASSSSAAARRGRAARPLDKRSHGEEGADEASGTRRGGVDTLAAELAALQLQPVNTQDNDDEDDDDDDDEDAAAAAAQASDTLKESYEVRKGGALLYPHRRMDAAVTIVDNTLYVYGGQFESGEKEVTMSDLFALHLGRLDGYEVLLSHDLSAAVWLGTASEGAASNSWESGSTVVSAAFDLYDEDDDDDDEDDEDKTQQQQQQQQRAAAAATAADIRNALQANRGEHTEDDNNDNNNNDDNNNDDDGDGDGDGDEAPEAIPVELDMEATPASIVDAVTHIRGRRGMQAHKARLLAQLGAAAAVPTPQMDESFAAFYERTSSFWLRAARDADGEDVDNDKDDNDTKDDKVRAPPSSSPAAPLPPPSPQQRRAAMAFARRRYAEARELLQQLRLVEEHERAEQQFFRERRLQREREWQAAADADKDDSDDDDKDDDGGNHTQQS